MLYGYLYRKTGKLLLELIHHRVHRGFLQKYCYDGTARGRRPNRIDKDNQLFVRFTVPDSSYQPELRQIQLAFRLLHPLQHCLYFIDHFFRHNGNHSIYRCICQLPAILDVRNLSVIQE